MRWGSTIALALAAGVAVPQLAAAQAGGQDTRPGIAVLTFDNGGSYGQDKENYDGLTVGLQQSLITELGSNPALRLVDRHQIKDLIAEQDLGASGRVDPQTAAKIGKLVGAKYVILASFIDFYGDFRIDARVVSVETSEIIKTQKETDKREKLFGLVTQLATDLTKGLNLPALPKQAMEQHQSRTVPTEALTFYSRALFYADRGDKSRAEELFNKAIQTFPNYTEAKEGLQQLKQS